MKRTRRSEQEAQEDETARSAMTHSARVAHERAHTPISPRDALLRNIAEKMLYADIAYGCETALGGWEKDGGDIPALKLSFTRAECRMLGLRGHDVQPLQEMLESVSSALCLFFAEMGTKPAMRALLAQPDMALSGYLRGRPYNAIRSQLQPVQQPRGASKDSAKYDVYMVFPHAVDLLEMQAQWRTYRHQFITQLPQLIQFDAIEHQANVSAATRV